MRTAKMGERRMHFATQYVEFNDFIVDGTRTVAQKGSVVANCNGLWYYIADALLLA